MPSRERKYDRAVARAARARSSLSAELRAARIDAGRSQREIAEAVRISASQLARIELGQNRSASLDTLMIIAAMLGLDLSVKTYPGERILRDGPQVRLLRYLRDRLGDAWAWRYEVLVAALGQRAWDARVRHRETGVEFVVEAETRIHDVQALLRRMALKRAADPGIRLILLVADTRSNRLAVQAAQQSFVSEFPGGFRACMRALSEGRVPSADTMLILGPTERRSPRQTVVALHS